MGARDDEFSVATFNVHAGIDGWGRRFDVTRACRSLDADVIVLQEAWTPDAGPSMSEAVARELGYEVTWEPMARGRRGLPNPDATDRWMPSRDVRTAANSLYLDGSRPVPARVRHATRYLEAEEGSWGLATLSRLPVSATSVIDLGRLAADRGRRAAIVLELEVGGTPVVVAGTHMSHLTSGSPLQFRTLRRELARVCAGRPAVLAGDMNLWGPPLRVLLPGWRRAVRGRTWPAWRPHSQADHVLVRDGVEALRGSVQPDAGSDHRPVRAVLRAPAR